MQFDVVVVRGTINVGFLTDVTNEGDGIHFV